MADGIGIALEGYDETVQALNALGDDMRRKVVLGALRDAAKPVVRVAKALAPVLDAPTTRRTSGTLRNAITAFKSKRYKASNGQLGVYITVKASRAARRRAPISGDPFYFRFVEGGHRARPKRSAFLTRALARRAAATMVKPQAFLGPAFAQQGRNALDIFTARIKERIAKAEAAK